MKSLFFQLIAICGLCLVLGCSDDEDKDILSESFGVNIEYNSTEGVVTVSPEKEKYELNDVITISATPKSNYLFCKWEGDVKETDVNKTSIEVVVSKDINLKAYFSAIDNDGILLQLSGVYNKDTKKWDFKVVFKNQNSSQTIKDADIVVDNNQFEYDSSFKQYNDLSFDRDVDSADFNIKISCDEIGVLNYTLPVVSFPQNTSLSYQKTEDGKAVNLSWPAQNASGYRVFRNLLSSSTSAKDVLKNIVEECNVTLTSEEIWTSNYDSWPPFDKALLWIAPIKRVEINNSKLSNKSFIEVVGKNTNSLQVKKAN